MNELEVKASKFPFVMIAIFGTIFLPLASWILFSGIRSGLKPVPLAIGIVMFAVFAGVVFLFLRGRSNSVKYFTPSGIERMDGRKLPWNELKRVVDKMASKSATRKGLWRTEIQFNDGNSAWLIPSKIANYKDVRAYVEALNCERVQEDA